MTKTTQHTPGQWKYVRVETLGHIIFHRVMCGNICIYEGDEQYACLIAAAAKLLEALEVITCYRPDAIDAALRGEVILQGVQMAKAAIAAAKGE